MNIRLLSKSDLKNRSKDFCELYNACFDNVLTEEIVARRYLDNPYDELLMCIAEDNGKFVSNYSALPARVIADGKELKAAISVNTMTHPDYAGQGLFTKLANILYDEMKKRNYSLIYVFPNLYSNKTYCTRLAWKDVYEIPTMTLNIPETLPEADAGVHEISFYDIGFKPENVLSVSKSPEYLHWRYEHQLELNYKAIGCDGGFAIYKKYRDEVNIVELHGDDESVRALTNYIICAATKDSCTKLTTWAQINTRKHYLLEKAGFTVQAPVRYFAVLQLCEKCDVDFYDYRLWSLSMGDDNVY